MSSISLRPITPASRTRTGCEYGPIPTRMTDSTVLLLAIRLVGDTTNHIHGGGNDRLGPRPFVEP